MRTELADVEIESLDSSGDGIARHAGRALRVPYTIPGERVRVSLDPRTFPLARPLDVLRASPHRVVARCPHFGPVPNGLCGGCSWQHIAYPEQLRLKSSLVTRLVRDAVRRAPAALPTLPATPIDDPWGYRQKVHFVFADGGVMGHYVRGSRRVIPVRECPVHDERGNRIAFRLRDSLAARRSSRDARARAAGRRRAAGVGHDESGLKSVAIRVGCHSPEVGATLVLRHDADRPVRDATRRILEGQDPPSSLHLNLHPKDDGYVFGRETRRIAGPARVREEVADTAFLISPTAFFQTNVRAAEILVRLVLEAVPPDASVLDLYAGAGLFALPLARAGHTVVAVEENPAAVADGEASARVNRIPPQRCRFIARPVEAVVSARTPPRADVVVLDPPREGCDVTVLDGVFGRIRPPLAVYVSCNPEALARDLAPVVRHGYRVQSLQPVDMFPHTAHVETVAVISRT